MEQNLSTLLRLITNLHPQHEDELNMIYDKRGEDAYSKLMAFSRVVGAENIKHAICAITDAPYIEFQDGVDTCVAMPSGFYDDKSGIYYLNQIHPQHLTGIDRIGFVVGKPVHVGCRQITSPAESNGYLDYPLDFGVFVESGVILKGTLGSKLPVKNATLFDSVYHNATYHTPYSNYWLKEISRIQSRIGEANSRTLHFLSGDAISSIVESEFSKIKSFFPGGVSTDINGEDSILFLPFSTAKDNAKQLYNIIALEGRHVIFYSDTVSAPRFFDEANRYWGLDFLVEYLSGYQFSRAIPEICEKCRLSDHSGSMLNDAMFNKSELIQNTFTRGDGCEHCKNGYTGIIWASEKVLKPGDMSKTLLEYKSSADFDDEGFSVHKLYDKINSAQGQTQARSVKALLEQGRVQMSDANKIML
tara:strand:- start:951 stop:2201 length:1251 start_codon:yes stop_codon:yes gene_type:complete